MDKGTAQTFWFMSKAQLGGISRTPTHTRGQVLDGLKARRLTLLPPTPVMRPLLEVPTDVDVEEIAQEPSTELNSEGASVNARLRWRNAASMVNTIEKLKASSSSPMREESVSSPANRVRSWRDRMKFGVGRYQKAAMAQSAGVGGCRACENGRPQQPVPHLVVSALVCRGRRVHGVIA